MDESMGTHPGVRRSLRNVAPKRTVMTLAESLCSERALDDTGTSVVKAFFVRATISTVIRSAYKL